MKRVVALCLVMLLVPLWSQEEDRPPGPGEEILPGEEEAPQQEAEEASEPGEEEAAPELPDWKQEELAEVEAGEYVPGSSLIGQVARKWLESDEDEVIDLAEEIPDLPEGEDGERRGPTELPESFYENYFHAPPEGLLNDPQELLTTQEFRDREAFLAYHARDMGIAFYLYLFDEAQILPEGLGLDSLVASQFEAGEPAAVVFYHLGAPTRSKLVFTERVIASCAEDERAGVFQAAIVEALEKSEPISQLEAFSLKLSAELAALEERIVAGGGSLRRKKTAATDQVGPGGKSETSWIQRLRENEKLFWGAFAGVVLLVAALCGWLGRWVASRRRSYVFPDAAGSTLFEAPHAAGVGGVLSFSSANAPPSSQKHDVPDYLQRM